MFCTHRDDYEAEVFLLYVESNQSNDGWLFLFLHGLPSPNITSGCLLLLTFSIIILMQLSYIVWQSKLDGLAVIIITLSYGVFQLNMTTWYQQVRLR